MVTAVCCTLPQRASQNWLADREDGSDRRHFIYVETGSYLGLSSHVVTATVVNEGVPIVSYAHDLFDSSSTDLWSHVMNNPTHLHTFYSNVRRNGYEQNIIPIIGSKRSLRVYVGFSVTASLLVSTGQSHETMAMHLDGSVDMVFIDGDHTYEGTTHALMRSCGDLHRRNCCYPGALADIREGFRILRPGGFLLGHDTVPVEKDVYHGGMGWNGVEWALRTFTAERGLSRHGAQLDGMSANAWSIVSSTAYMFLIMKGPVGA
jgi:hypothetical protein